MNRLIARCGAVGAGAMAVLATAICSATPVSAAASYTVDSTASTGDALPGNGVCADASAHCTLTAALEEAEAAGAPAAIVVAAGTYPLVGPITITADITVTGAGRSATTIDLGNGSGVVVDGARFALVDVGLRGGVNAIDGGAIRAVDADVSLTRVRATSNRSDASGGAIQATGGSLRITDSEFVDNTALVGGAVAVTYTSLAVTGSTFSGNGASGDGGAIFASYPAGLAIADSTFDDNVALGRGGAVFVNGVVGDAATTPLFISGSDFTDNSAGNEGGAVFVGSTTNGTTARTFGIDDSMFENNTGLVGGAVAIDLGTVEVSASEFNSNHAVGGSGGAIGSGGSLGVTASSFTGNDASQSGGAIAANGPTSIAGSSFESNESGALGGGVALSSDSTPSVSSSSFTNNVADVAAGAIWRLGDALDQRSITLSGNQPAGEAVKIGGPTYAAEPTEPTLPTEPPTSTTPVSTTPASTAPASPAVSNPTMIPASGAAPTSSSPAPSSFDPIGALPETGTTIIGVLAIGALLVGIGLVLRLARRRRSVAAAAR